MRNKWVDLFVADAGSLATNDCQTGIIDTRTRRETLKELGVTAVGHLPERAFLPLGSVSARWIHREIDTPLRAKPLQAGAYTIPHCL